MALYEKDDDEEMNDRESFFNHMSSPSKFCQEEIYHYRHPFGKSGRSVSEIVQNVEQLVIDFQNKRMGAIGI